MLAPLLALLLQAPAPQVPTKATLPFEQLLVEAPAREILEVPAGTTRLQAKTLPVDRAAGTVPSGGGKGRSQGQMLGAEKGLRLLLVDLAPGEKLRFVLGGDGAGTLIMGLAASPTPDGMEEETARVNRILPRLRTRELEVQNVTPGVYPVLLKVAGPAGLPYTLDLQRKPAAPK
ncbi:MAG: hypothetical protein WCO20_01790 [Holophagaceae bacterium]